MIVSGGRLFYSVAQQNEPLAAAQHYICEIVYRHRAAGKKEVPMRLVRTLVPLSLTAMAGYAQDVHYNYDRNADFAKYKTYRWVEIDGAIHLDALTDQQLKNAIDVELSRKGLIETKGNEPDLLICYQAATDHKEQFNTFTGGFGTGWGNGLGWGDANHRTSSIAVQPIIIHVGSLGFDMYDTDQKQLVWRGEATKTIDIRAKPDKRQTKIEMGVAKLLKNYPPVKR
jgi:hypothetical protein